MNVKCCVYVKFRIQNRRKRRSENINKSTDLLSMMFKCTLPDFLALRLLADGSVCVQGEQNIGWRNVRTLSKSTKTACFSEMALRVSRIS